MNAVSNNQNQEIISKIDALIEGMRPCRTCDGMKKFRRSLAANQVASGSDFAVLPDGHVAAIERWKQELNQCRVNGIDEVSKIANLCVIAEMKPLRLIK